MTSPVGVAGAALDPRVRAFVPVWEAERAGVGGDGQARQPAGAGYTWRWYDCRPRPRGGLPHPPVRRPRAAEATVVVLGRRLGERGRRLLLRALRDAAGRPGPTVLATHGAAGAALVRSVYLEGDVRAAGIVRLPSGGARLLDRELAARTDGYREVTFEPVGRRLRPRLRCVDLGGEATDSLSRDDVCLVTGGGRGVGLACARALARRTGARLALLDVVDPAMPAVAAGLRALRADGIRPLLVRADVTDPRAVRAAVDRVRTELGGITAVVHAAAHNRPRPFAGLSCEELDAHRWPKVDGLCHVLDAVDTGRLRMVVAFGSILGRVGHGGLGAYALANEELEQYLRQVRAGLPGCRCVTIEWSVWSGVGSVARLGAVDAVRAAGITTVSPAVGTRWFLAIAALADPPPTVVVCGSMGGLPTMPPRDLGEAGTGRWPRVGGPVGPRLVTTASWNKSAADRSGYSGRPPTRHQPARG